MSNRNIADFITFSVLGLLLSLVAAFVSASEKAEPKYLPDNERWQQFNLSAIENHIVPNYRSLAAESSRLVTSVNLFCQQRLESDLESAKMQFKAASQAWQKIQHIQFGPVTILMRNFSLQYWPDKKNLGGKQLSLLLKNALESEEGNNFDSEFFANASVAVKGYPAIERMLFDPKVISQLEQNPSYCPLLQAISQHVANNTASIAKEWAAELNNYKDYSEEAVYESSKEAAVEILKALVEPIEAISDGKIAAPLGKSVERIRWRKSESWRSQQSIANIVSNINTLHHLYSGIGSNSTKQLLIETGKRELAETIDQQFKGIMTLLAKISEPLDMVYQQLEYDQLLIVQDKLKRLSDNLLLSMQALDINLGFNRRDGD